MDKRDLKLIAALDSDPKATTSKLAREIGVSPQVATYRLNKLFEKDVVSECVAAVNYSRIGLDHYRILFRLNSTSEVKKKELYKFLKSLDAVEWINAVGGVYDLILLVTVKDHIELDKFFTQIERRFPKLVRDRCILYVTYREMYNYKRFNKTPKLIKYSSTKDVYKIDETDNRLLKELQDNCRTPVLKLSEKLKIPYKTVINKIKRLEQNDVIVGYKMFLSSQVLRGYYVLVSYTNYSKLIENKLFKDLRVNEHVAQVIKSIGKWDLMLIFRTDSERSLQKVIVDLRNKYDIIENYEILPIF